MKKISVLIFTFCITAVMSFGIVDTGFEVLDSLGVDNPFRDIIIDGRGGCSITAHGIVKVPIIFVDREFLPGNTYPDNVQSNYWPLGGDPQYMSDFINSSLPPQGYQWPRMNLTKYLHVMSNGLYNYIGDTYRYTIPAGVTFTNTGQLSSHVLAQMDPLIDYAQYDHWKTNTSYDHDYYENPTTDADRYVDWVFIVYRFRLSDMIPSINYTGYTPIQEYTSQDMILGQPVKIGGWGRGSAQGGMRESGFSGITHVCLHELAHALFPYGHNGRLAGLSVLSANQVGWGTSIWGMNAWEREKLAWMNYNTVTSDEIVTLPDYMTNFTALKIPTSSPSRFYVIERLFN